MFLPKAIGLLSRHAFYDFFRDYLCQLVWSSTRGLSLPLERYIVNLTQEVPLPPRGKIEVAVTIDTMRLFCSRPPLNTSSLMKNVRTCFLIVVVFFSSFH